MNFKYYSPVDLLDAKSKLNVTNGCREWLGYLTPRGYALIPNYYWAKIYQVSFAHQLSYILKYGEYNRSLHILHNCHNAKCINADHLRVGTQADNMLDMIQAGRDNKASGLTHYKVTLTKETIRAIKRYLGSKLYTQVELAKMFKVSPQMVSRIKLQQRHHFGDTYL